MQFYTRFDRKPVCAPATVSVFLSAFKIIMRRNELTWQKLTPAHCTRAIEKRISAKVVGRGWRIGRVDAFRPKGIGFDCRSSRHVGTLGKSLTHSCLWRSGVKLRHSIRAVSGALLSRIRLKEAL